MAEGGGTSLLGTKEYWDDSYARELVNFEHTGDIGEVWFGHQSQTRIANWLAKCPHLCKQSKILDIGCGNGALLFDLAERGFEDLTGVDYCEGAIELARQCAKMEGITVKLLVADILNIDSSPLNGRVFDVCLDKGTYDVISLTPSNAEERKATYVHSTAALLKASGLLIVASCNWTEEELRKQFESEYSCIASIPAPKFQFGGHTGQTVSTVVLQKKNLCSGLGTKFVGSDTANHKPPSAPVQLNPVEVVPTNKLEFMADKTKVLPPIKESVENLPVPLSASRTADQKMETDSGLETKVEGLGEEVSPGYHYNPMELNNCTTCRKVLEPVKLSRTRKKN